MLHAPLAAAPSFHRHARWAETAGGAAEGQYCPPPQEQPPTPPIHGPATRELRGEPSGMIFFKTRSGSSTTGAPRRGSAQQSSGSGSQFSAHFEGGLSLASRGGVATGGPAGAADGGTGGTDPLADGVVAGGADAVAGAAGGVADGGDATAAGGDGIGAAGVGGAVASLDRRKICSLTKELTDDIALSALWRTAATRSKTSEACWPRPRKPRKP
jgi:hypothetical protein